MDRTAHGTGETETAVQCDHLMGGLRVRSCISLPGVAVPAEAGEPDVVIRYGAIPASVEHAQQAAFWEADGALLISIRGVARYRIEGGRDVVIDAVPGAQPEDLLLYLTGSVFGAVWHQRGLFPLHASVLDVGGLTVGFAGGSGAGKSTLAAFLIQRGHRLVNDDAGVVAMLANGRIGVWPGAPRLKLGRPVLSQLGEAIERLDPAGGTRGKYHLPAERATPQTAPMQLDRLYVLKDGEADPWIQRVQGLDAIDIVAGHTYCRDFVDALGLRGPWFRQVAAVASALDVRRLVRPYGFEHMGRVIEVLEADWVRSAQPGSERTA